MNYKELAIGIKQKYTTFKVTSLLPGIAIAFLYIVTGKLSFDLLNNNEGINCIGLFAPEGIALAFALYFGKRVVPGIFIGQFVLAYTNNINFLPSFAVAVINSIEALIGIYVFNKFELSKELKTFRDAFGLVFIIALILQPFSAIFSNAVLLLDGFHLTASEFLYAVFSWWFGNVMGQFLLTPFLLLFFIHFKKIDFKDFLLIGALFGVYIYFLTIIIAIENPFLLMCLTMPVITFIVSKKGILYGTFMSAIVAMIASYSVYFGIGAFYLRASTDNIINYNIFILAHMAVVLVVGILFDEQKRQKEILHVTVQDEINKNQVQQVLMLQQSRLAQMGEMISVIAHQWRQPLSVIGMSAFNIQSKIKLEKFNFDDKASREKFLQLVEDEMADIHRYTRYLTGTIDDFTNFFKPDKEKELTSLNIPIEKALKILHSLILKENIQITVDISIRNHIKIYTYEVMQVVLNIIKNSIDNFMEKNIENPSIAIRAREDAHKFTIQICDNGGGIDESILPKIFDPYFSTKSEKNGTGLGLYISKIVIENHSSGLLNVRNEKNGVCFEIIFYKDQ
ncbi:ATP-binding protein [Sulfurimonas sp. HSL3-2]|uniref:ATP-binding protein n=1 Tax=Hydrocurvibacter mobilis TaxID=3131936 RepID=UPI0031F7A6BE